MAGKKMGDASNPFVVSRDQQDSAAGTRLFGDDAPMSNNIADRRGNSVLRFLRLFPSGVSVDQGGGTPPEGLDVSEDMETELALQRQQEAINQVEDDGPVARRKRKGNQK